MQNKKEIYEEHFKQIKGYENYLVSDRGRVYSEKNKKFLKPQKNRCGYLTVTLYKNGISKICTKHRLVALAFIPNPDKKPQVNHIDGIKTNNHVENLEWCTNSENKLHSNKLGLETNLKGEEHPNNKYSLKRIILAKKLLKISNLTQVQIGCLLNISVYTISAIKRNKQWTHV